VFFKAAVHANGSAFGFLSALFFGFGLSSVESASSDISTSFRIASDRVEIGPSCRFRQSSIRLSHTLSAMRF
jgi:hypothetical protein